MAQGKGTWRGHTLHLVLIAFPIGMWTAATIFDGIGAVVHDPFWFRAAAMLVVAGTVAGIIAAIPGLLDYFSIAFGKAGGAIARAHLWWSLTMLAFFVVATVVRAIANASPVGIVLTALGTATLFGAAWVGADLVNRTHAGIPER